MLSVALLLAGAVLGADYRDCTDIKIPTLHKNTNQKAMVCAPYGAPAGKRYPVIAYSHGDTLGPGSYKRSLQRMANEGFVVVAYRSCGDDDDCDDGKFDYIEVLKTLIHIDNPDMVSDDVPVDMSQPISLAGHSTGGRCGLIVAGLQSQMDTHFLQQYTDGKEPKDYKDFPEVRRMDEEEALIPRLMNKFLGKKPKAVDSMMFDRMDSKMRKMLMRIKVVAVDHGDEMYATTHDWSGMVDNPDPKHFKITKTPILVWTGSEDTGIEPRNSSYRNFADYIQSPERVFIDIKGEGHLRSTNGNAYQPHPFVEFIRTHAFNNKTAAKYFYGPNPGIMNEDFTIAGPDDTNNANMKAGYVACSKKYGDSTLNPTGMEKELCMIKTRYKWTSDGWDIPMRCQGAKPDRDCF